MTTTPQHNCRLYCINLFKLQQCFTLPIHTDELHISQYIIQLLNTQSADNVQQTIYNHIALHNQSRSYHALASIIYNLLHYIYTQCNTVENIQFDSKKLNLL